MKNRDKINKLRRQLAAQRERLKNFQKMGDGYKETSAAEELVSKILEARIRELEQIEMWSENVVPTWNLETGWIQYSQTLALLRRFANLTQKQMAELMQTKQSAIARLEDSMTHNYELDTLQRWAEVCNYRFLGLFSRIDSPINQIGIETASLKSVFDNPSLAVLKIFLKRLQVISKADLYTCYLMTHLHSTQHSLNTKARMVLVDLAGIRQREDMLGTVKNDELPVVLYNKRKPILKEYALNNQKFGGVKSKFMQREDIKWFMALPFRVKSAEGIIFLNYRNNREKPTDVHHQLLEKVPNMIEFLLSGKGDPLNSSIKIYEKKSLQLSEFLKDLVLNGWDKNTSIDKLKKIICQMLELNVDLDFVVYRRQANKLVLDHDPPRTFKGKSQWLLDASESVPVLIAANNCRYILNEDQSELAVPVKHLDGWVERVLAIQNPEGEREPLTPGHARLLESIGQSVNSALHAHNLMRQQKQILGQVTELFDGLAPTTGRKKPMKIEKQLKNLAELGLHIFDAALVDIWYFDREKNEFSEEYGVHCVSSEYKDRCKNEYRITPPKTGILRPRRSGSSMEMMRDISKRIKKIPDISKEPNVNSVNFQFNLRSSIGMVVAGHDSAVPEGIVWLRFDRKQRFNDSVERQLSIFTKFVHLIWNPVHYDISIEEHLTDIDAPGLIREKHS